MDSLDFELEIGATTSSGYSVSARVKGGGEASTEMTWALTGRDLDAQLAIVRDSVIASSATVRRMASLDEQPVRDLGRRLFDAAISGDVRLLYASAYQQSRQQGRHLRLVLRVRPPDLARLPWEYLFDSNDDEYLGLRLPVIRYPQSLEPQRPLNVAPPLRILAMVAVPGDQALLDAQTERTRLETALSGIQRQGLVELQWVEGQSWRDLQTAMDRGRWHVFHFIGHGSFDPHSAEGVLALVDEDGGSFALGASDLSLLLIDHFSLRLVLLNACDTGRASSIDFFSSTAGALVRRGIPAAVAMQFEITDRASIEFARSFYRALADGLPVDECVVRARRAVKLAHANTLEWGTPVLFLRSSDGYVFDLSGRAAKQPDAAADPQVDELYRAGLAAYHTGRWADAVAYLRQVLALQRGHPEAETKLTEALRQHNLQTAYADASVAMDEERWADAAAAFSAVIAGDPGYRYARQGLEEARRRLEIGQLRDEARQLYEAGHWAAVVRVGDQLEALDAAAADPDGMVSAARQRLADAERRQEMNHLRDEVRRHYNAGDWTSVLQAGDRLQALDAAAADPEGMVSAARQRLAEAERRAEMDRLRDEVRRHYNAGDWTSVLQAGDRLLAIDAAAADPGGMVSAARQRLADAYQRQRIDELRAEARRQYDARNWLAVVHVGDQIHQINAAAADPDGIVTAARQHLAGARRTAEQARPRAEPGPPPRSGGPPPPGAQGAGGQQAAPARSGRKGLWIVAGIAVTLVTLAIMPGVCSARGGNSSSPTPTPSSSSASPTPANQVVFDDDFNGAKPNPWNESASPFAISLKQGSLHASVTKQDAAYYEGYPSATTYSRLRIDAVMVKTAGDGSLGVSCKATGTAGYDFWVGPGGLADVDLAGEDVTKSSTTLHSFQMSGWDPSKRHTLSAICSASSSGTSLEFLIDGQSVVKTTDHTYVKDFLPCFLVESAKQATLDIDVLRFTVTSLP